MDELFLPPSHEHMVTGEVCEWPLAIRAFREGRGARPDLGEYLHLWGPALDYVLAHAFIVRTRAAASFFSARCTWLTSHTHNAQRRPRRRRCAVGTEL